jgi:3-oxoacyl-[acyl-carrier protein] reductase
MRNVVVTGGSRGIGQAITRRLLDGGYRVHVIARNAPADRPTCDGFVFHECDLAETDRLAALVSEIRSQHGPIYGLVNNAGASSEGLLAMMQVSQIERLIRLNVLAPILLTRQVVRGMLSDGEGRIVNISSIMAFTGYSGLAVYGATKSSMIGFTRSLAREVGRAGITVNAIAPGFVETQMTQSLTEKLRERIIRRSALHRLTEVDDVASAVEFLLGDGAKNITGTVLTVDAGSTA